MKIAMPYQDGVLLEHFGRAKEFIIYNVSDLDPVTSEVIAPEDLSHAAVARVLKEHGVDGLHVYTMNRPSVASAAMQALGR